MSANSREVTHRAAARKAAGAQRPIYGLNRAARPWRFQLSTDPLKLVLTLAVSVAAGTVIHTHLKAQIQEAARNSVVKQSAAVPLPSYGGLPSGADASEPQQSGHGAVSRKHLVANLRRPLRRAGGQGQSSSLRRRALAKAPVTRIAARPDPGPAKPNPSPAKSQGGLHSVGRGVKHVGGFLSSPFRHKKSTASTSETSSNGGQPGDSQSAGQNQ